MWANLKPYCRYCGKEVPDPSNHDTIVRFGMGNTRCEDCRDYVFRLLSTSTDVFWRIPEGEKTSLTEEMILTMEAGLDLSALVAQEIFGADVFWVQKRPYSDPALDDDCCPFCGYSNWDATEVPSFSESVLPAYKAVEYANQRGLEVIVVSSHDGNLAACMVVEGTAAPYPPMDVFFDIDALARRALARVQASTVPEAICKALLVARLKVPDRFKA